IDCLATLVTFCAVPLPRPPALVLGWSDDGVGCVAAILNTVALALFPESLLSGYVAFCQDPRRFITRLAGRRYLWCRCRLAMTSNKHWCLPSKYPPSSDVATKSADRRGSM
ncbi:hypothetical protein N9381_07185, partial [Paracoccaceae bacterium]|nr:hypothetical protein [Paracoccaceae bacterium]